MAELKLSGIAIVGGVAFVTHGFTAVAELKRVPPRHLFAVLAVTHGFTAVAELKPGAAR